jgi:hypothetical protein
MSKTSFLIVAISLFNSMICNPVNIEIESKDARIGYAKKGSCKSLPLDKLNAQLLEHYRTTTLLFYASSDLSTYESDLAFELSEIEDPNLIDHSQCRLSERNTTLTVISQRSTCPWVYLIKYREDKFPHFLREAKCTCRTCNLVGSSHLSSMNYGCLPILKRVPVLTRNANKCDKDGYYTWSPSVEIVNMGCTCSFQIEFIQI